MERGLDHSGGLRSVEVAWDRDRTATQVGGERLERRRAARDQRDARSVTREPPCDRRPDATRRARDERHTAGERTRQLSHAQRGMA
jgi:hypothetical protein